MYCIQLPDDVKTAGYRRNDRNRFELEQLFFSPSLQFTGSESDFVNAGHGYRYIQIDKFTRIVVK